MKTKVMGMIDLIKEQQFGSGYLELYPGNYQENKVTTD